MQICKNPDNSKYVQICGEYANETVTVTANLLVLGQTHQIGQVTLTPNAATATLGPYSEGSYSAQAQAQADFSGKQLTASASVNGPLGLSESYPSTQIFTWS